MGVYCTRMVALHSAPRQLYIAPGWVYITPGQLHSAPGWMYDLMSNKYITIILGFQVISVTKQSSKTQRSMDSSWAVNAIAMINVYT